MVQVEKRELPTCGTACCGGVVPGSFRNSSNAPNVHDYVADQNEGCSYFSYRRAEVPTSISALVLACFSNAHFGFQLRASASACCSGADMNI